MKRLIIAALAAAALLAVFGMVPHRAWGAAAPATSVDTLNKGLVFGISFGTSRKDVAKARPGARSRPDYPSSVILEEGGKAFGRDVELIGWRFDDKDNLMLTVVQFKPTKTPEFVEELVAKFGEPRLLSDAGGGISLAFTTPGSIILLSVAHDKKDPSLVVETAAFLDKKYGPAAE